MSTTTTAYEFTEYQVEPSTTQYAFTQEDLNEILKKMGVGEDQHILGFKCHATSTNETDVEKKGGLYFNCFIVYDKELKETAEENTIKLGLIGVTKVVSGVNQTNTVGKVNIYADLSDTENKYLAQMIETNAGSSKLITYSFLNGLFKIEQQSGKSATAEDAFKITFPRKSDGFHGKKVDFLRFGFDDYWANISATKVN